MIFSDALPVQFWLTGCETFNEKEVDGVFSRCFCAPFNCADEITLQFTHSTGNSFSLLIRDFEGAALGNILSFSEVSTGVYQLSFTPNTEGICDEYIQLFVIKATGKGAQALLNPDFTTNLNNWTQTGAGETWSQSGGEAVVTVDGTSLQTAALTQAIDLTGAYHLQSFIHIVGFAGTPTDYLIEFFSLDPITAEEIIFYSTSGSFLSTDINLTIDTFIEVESTVNSIKVRFTRVQTVLNNAVEIDYIYLSPVTLEHYAKSDCLSIKEDHDESVLINYNNNRIFASLNSSVGTPDPEFNLRLYAIFSESDDRNPRESESMDLSDNTSFQTMAQIKRQRPLKIKHMPSYMHQKTILALSFQNVTIDGLTWEMREAYEKAPGNPKFPLKSAQVWLNDRNYTLRNVL